MINNVSLLCIVWNDILSVNQITHFSWNIIITFVPEPLIYSSLQCRVLMNNLLSACGDNEFFFTESGKLYTFGSNDWGQLGHGNTVQLSRPKLVKRKWLMQTKNKKNISFLCTRCCCGFK